MTRWRTRNRRRRRALEGPKIKGLSWADCWSSDPVQDILDMRQTLQELGYVVTVPQYCIPAHRMVQMSDGTMKRADEIVPGDVLFGDVVVRQINKNGPIDTDTASRLLRRALGGADIETTQNDNGTYSHRIDFSKRKSD